MIAFDGTPGSLYSATVSNVDAGVSAGQFDANGRLAEPQESTLQFTGISSNMLKICNMPQFTKFKSKKPKNIDDINNLANYVSLKIDAMSV